MSYLQLHIEAIIFTATAPVRLSDIKAALEKTFHPEKDKKEAKPAEKEASAEEEKPKPEEEKEVTEVEKETAEDNKEASVDEKEIAEDNEEVSVDEKEIQEGEKEIIEDNKEVSEDEKKIEESEKEIAEDNEEASVDEKEIKDDEKEITEDSKEVSEKENTEDEKVIAENEKVVQNNKKVIAKVEKKKPENEIPEAQIIEVLKDIKEKYIAEDFAWELRKSGGGYQFLTKPPYFNTIANLLNLKTKRKLTRSAMETLAIVAYKQPATKAELEHIRGVSCDYALQKLLDKELVIVSGRADGPGKPLLYSTSTTFMDYFGINSPNDMPTLKEFQTADQEIGDPQE